MFTVTLLGVFALAALFVAIMGAQVYSRSAQNLEANFDTRTSLVYISEKVRQCAGEDFTVEQVDGNDALVLREKYSGNAYESWIYIYDGKLYEVMVAEGVPVKGGDGQSIMNINSLSITDTDGLITITIENLSGETNSLSLSRRT
jgi:hypothetical protein